MPKRSAASAAKEPARPRAVVTGASSGIGAAFAAELAARQHDLIIVARSRERLDGLAKQLRTQHGVSVDPLAADLVDAAQLRIVEDVIADTDIDLLVNNAGFGTIGRFAELDPEQEEAEIRLNVLALMRLTRAALPGMVERGQGSVINVSSMAGLQPAPYNATYCATKAFVTSFTEALSEELRGTGVSVQALCPGFTRTEFQERAGIDVSGIPGMVWMSAESVVQASLASLRRGNVICIPGVQNKVVATLVGAMPRGITRRVTAVLARNLADQS